MFTISVCMIVKDEEKTIERVLSCAKKFADEIIVVDTGSKDNTVNLAKKYTDKIFHFEWCDDFSKARNYSFSLGSCDYLMWLDGDDVITQKNIDKILLLKRHKNDADVFMFKYVTSFDENGKPSFNFYRERLLKRVDNFKWEGFVHEAISPFGKIEYCDIEIEHRKIQVNEEKRNLKLYRKAKKRGVIFGAREQYYYARELYYSRYYKSAIIKLKKYLKMNDPYEPNIVGAYLILAECELLIGQSNSALNHLFECMKKYPANAQICVMIASIYEMKNDFSKAIFWNKCALNCEKPLQGFIVEEYYGFIPYMKLVVLYDKLGDNSNAKKYHELAKALKPNNASVLYNEKYFSIKKL